MTSTNPLLRKTIVLLERAGKEQKAPIWSAASDLMSRSARTKVEVNLGRISRIAGDGQAVFVPGKVLGYGAVDKKLTIGAYSFSESAKSKIVAQGGTALSVELFVKKFPKGSGVRLVQ